MIQCPKCGHQNLETAMNCVNCHINLQYALQNLTQLQAQWQKEGTPAAPSDPMQARMSSLILTTTPTIQGRTITDYLGVAFASIALGTGLLSEINAGIADALGVRASGFQEKIGRAREMALDDLKRQTAQYESDAIVGLDMEYTTATGNILLVHASGTLVRLSPPTNPVAMSAPSG